MEPKPGDLVCLNPDAMSINQKKGANFKGIWLLVSLPENYSITGIATILSGEDKVPVYYKYLKRYDPEKEI